MGATHVPPDRHPDAAVVPDPFRGLSDEANLIEFKRLYGPLFGVERVYRKRQPGERLFFLHKDPDDTLFHPKMSAHAGLERYDWYVVGETDASPLGLPRWVPSYASEPAAVKFGWLRDPQAVVPASAAARAAVPDMLSQYEALRSRAGRLATLQRQGKLTPAEQGERDELAAALAAAPPPASVKF